VREIWVRACGDLETEEVTLEFSRELIWRLSCPHCGQNEEIFAPVGSVPYEKSACPRDGHRRVVETLHGYTGSEPWDACTLRQIGLPPFDVLVARGGGREIGYVIDGDRAAVLPDSETESASL
jgi:hypothetical protein